jgi:hypothetical protein
VGAKTRESVEVAGAFLLIVAALWIPSYSAVFIVAAALWIAVATFIGSRKVSELGLVPARLKTSAWVAATGAVLAAAIVSAGALMGTLHAFPWPPYPLFHGGVYAVWAFIQQFIALSFFFVRFERLLGSSTRAVIATSVLFGAVHLPNWVLVTCTAVMGLVFAELFRRYRNIYWLGLAHALLGIAVAVSVPDALHHQMRVGVAYLHYPNGQ